jgi:hypothetical protein
MLDVQASFPVFQGTAGKTQKLRVRVLMSADTLTV